MKILFVILLIPIFVSFAFAQSPTPTLFEEDLAPRMQIFQGIAPVDVTCKTGFELIFKYSNGNPACVKPETAKKLVDSKWGIIVPFGYPGEKPGWTKGWGFVYCESAGGLWNNWSFGVGRGPECNLSTSDAGKECTDYSQCESWCEAREGANTGSQESGFCHGYKLANCMHEVIDGVVEQEWCT